MYVPTNIVNPPIPRELTINQVLVDAIDATKALEQNPSVVQVSQVAVEEQGDNNDVIMEEDVTDESMKEVATTSDSQPVDKGNGDADESNTPCFEDLMDLCGQSSSYLEPVFKIKAEDLLCTWVET
ncbi:hypothetical protein L6452_08606 [Arctium lappa]|uniref:Uncharacterized protein n=1 Tax=Arctium lappa TaxID=4217 RepID=A0ACB9DHN8_ARCLA|nr:hypothetical protein L6452_08606 [Arctium lappa]